MPISIHNKYPYPLMEIGRGGFGVVYKTLSNAGELIAIKKIRLNEAGEREVYNLKRLSQKQERHPNVVDWHCCFRCGQYIWLEMEFCAGGSLSTYFWRHQLQIHQKLKIMIEIAAGVAYLHRCKVVHRDLKPDNVMMKYQSSYPVVKIGDFGLSKAILTDQCLGGFKQYQMCSRIGSEFYVAPEVLCGSYKYKADIFSMGLIFTALMTETYLPLSDNKRWVPFDSCKKDMQIKGTSSFS